MDEIGINTGKHMMIRTAVLEDANRLLDIYAFYVKKTAISFEYDVPSLG